MELRYIDITTADPKDILSAAELNIGSAGVAYLERAKASLSFERTLRIAQYVATVTLRTSPAIPMLEERLKDSPGGYAGTVTRFTEGSGAIETTLLLKAATEFYQAFELFLGDILEVLFFTFPKFLTTQPESVVLPTMHYDDLFSTQTLIEARRLVVRRKVVQFLMAENIEELLRKTEQRFSVSFSSLSAADRKALLELSARRNLWVHNAGIVNDIYMRLMRRYRITTTLALGAPASADDAYVDSVRELADRSVTAIMDALVGGLHNIHKHHAKL